MFRREVHTIGELVSMYLRREGLETPLLQKRLVDSWETVVGKTVAGCTAEKFVKNQTLFVKIVNPALRQDLSMMRTQIVRRLNAQVGAMIIADLRVY